MKHVMIVLLSVVFALELTALTYSAPPPSIKQFPYNCLILAPAGWIPCRDVPDLQVDA